MEKPHRTGVIEQMATMVVGLRQWLFTSWRIAILLAKGAYLLAERRQLFIKLGERTYAQIGSGQLKNSELEPLARELHRITKKVQIEELLIQRLRFGKTAQRILRNQMDKSQTTPS
jgi:hypothetical protein